MGYTWGVEKLVYLVPGMSCDHCTAAVTAEVSALAGVDTVLADLATKRVEVHGVGLDDAAIRAAIDEAGYDIA
jgi:copper chaperone CopZ